MKVHEFLLLIGMAAVAIVVGYIAAVTLVFIELTFLLWVGALF